MNSLRGWCKKHPTTLYIIALLACIAALVWLERIP